MTKSELIERLVSKYSNGNIPDREIENGVKLIIEQMSEALTEGNRIEIRGFGSFSLHYRAPRTGRNPKTGDSVTLDSKYSTHFKPGKELRESVNESRKTIKLRPQ